jgi:diguanylate cyclase (GGDEF)-like protein/putative nucleotidyltransferase with HDIG domain
MVDRSVAMSLTGIENFTKNGAASPREELISALRRDICQILEFNFGLIDLVKGDQIVSLLTFCIEEQRKDAQSLVDKLEDENGKPISDADGSRVRQVRETCLPWVGRAALSKVASARLQADPRHPKLPEDESSYQYAIVPIYVGAGTGAHQVKGLLRVVTFDSQRQISKEDLSTLRLIGEHLAGRLEQLAAVHNHDQASSPGEGGKVLLVHTNRPLRRRFSRVLSSHYQILEADGAEKALEQLNQGSVELIVLDHDSKDFSGTSLCKVLKESPLWKHLPVILITPEGNVTARIEGLLAGAEDCVTESCLEQELVARVQSTVRHSKAERERDVLNDRLEDYAKRLESESKRLSGDSSKQLLDANQNLKVARLESEVLRMQDTLVHRISNTIRRSFNIEQNLTVMLEELAGWLNLDCCYVVMPSGDEPEDSIRCEYATREEYSVKAHDLDLKALEVYQKSYAPDYSLIVNDATTDQRLEPYRGEALERLHILSIFFVPITYEEKLLGILVGFKCESEASWIPDNETFLLRVADQIGPAVILARLYAREQRRATTDGLTGLFNHRTGQEKLSEQLKVAERYQKNVSALMIDVDHFKSINDAYGHPAGDAVLKAVAQLIRRDCRDVDLPVRYGGEEFLLVLPEVNREGAMVVAERIRKNLAQTSIEYEGIQIKVTASMGIAAYPKDAQAQQQLLDLADKALYLSKRLGRNQVHAANELNFEETPSPEPQPPKSTAEAAEQIKFQSSFVPPEIPESAKDKEELVPEVIDMVKSLASTLYSKSDYNYVHHIETARISELLARVMGLTKPQIEQIRLAGLLHDVGTLSLPSGLLSKEGNLTNEERQILNQHAVLGADLLRPVRALKDICEILENHHERWDGTGYPNGLKGEQIPLPARILSIVDSYHAMISDRPYRAAMTSEKAVQTLKAGSGSQWDPFLVDIFITVLSNLKQNPNAADSR